MNLPVMQAPVDIGGGRTIKVNTSIGTALYPDGSRDINELIQYADQSTYKVKQVKRDAC